VDQRLHPQRSRLPLTTRYANGVRIADLGKFEEKFGKLVDFQRGTLADAVTEGQLGPSANEEGAIYLVSTIIVGVLSQTLLTSLIFPRARAISPECSPR
jgi:hypothetical protein